MIGGAEDETLHVLFGHRIAASSLEPATVLLRDQCAIEYPTKQPSTKTRAKRISDDLKSIRVSHVCRPRRIDKCSASILFLKPVARS